MATLIYWQDEATSAIAVVRFDAVTSVTPEDVLTITDHPVEQGANVVDHARKEPTRISIEGIVSTIPNPRVDTDTGFRTIELSGPFMRAGDPQKITLEPPKPPLNFGPGSLLRAAVVGIGEAIFGGPNLEAEFAGESTPIRVPFKAQVLQQNAPRDRVRDVYDALLRVQEARQLVQVSTRDRDLTDMMIERIAEPRSVGEGKAAKFQIDLRRIRAVGSVVVAAPKPTEERGKTNVNKGAQAGAKDEDPKQRRKTLAKAALDALRGGG